MRCSSQARGEGISSTCDADFDRVREQIPAVGLPHLAECSLGFLKRLRDRGTLNKELALAGDTFMADVIADLFQKADMVVCHVAAPERLITTREARRACTWHHHVQSRQAAMTASGVAFATPGDGGKNQSDQQNDRHKCLDDPEIQRVARHEK